MIGLCRNIKTLYNFDPPATDDEIHAAVLQYVRKITGFTEPSAANEAAFNRAVVEVEKASSRLLGSLVTTLHPKTAKSKLPRHMPERNGGSVQAVRRSVDPTLTKVKIFESKVALFFDK